MSKFVCKKPSAFSLFTSTQKESLQNHQTYLVKMPLCINAIEQLDTNHITLLCVTNLMSRSCSPEIKNRVSKYGGN